MARMTRMTRMARMARMARTVARSFSRRKTLLPYRELVEWH